MKNFINLVIVFLLFQSVIPLDEIETLLNILYCMEQKNEANKTQIISAINRLNNNPFNIIEVYNFLQNNIYAVNHCTNNLEDLPESMKKYISPMNKHLSELNWGLYLDCLLKYNQRNISLKYFIDLIISKNYYDAFQEEKKLLMDGSEAVLICAGKKNEGIIPSEMCYKRK